MHKPVKYLEKGLSIAANGAWFVYDRYNAFTQNPSFTTGLVGQAAPEVAPRR